MGATLRQIRAGLKSTLVAYYQSGNQQIQVYDTVPGKIEAPAVVIEPGSGDYQQTLGNTDRTEHTLAVTVLVALGDREAAQNRLDDIISAVGAASVAAGIDSDRSLGGTVEWSNASGYHDYGTVTYAEASYIKATVDVVTVGLS